MQELKKVTIKKYGNQKHSYNSPLRYEDWARYEEENSAGDVPKKFRKHFEVFLWTYKQCLNICTEWDVVVLGWKGVWKAAAAHVNNITALLWCRRSERTNKTDEVLTLGSHQSFGQRVGVFRGQQLPDLPPLPLPVLPLRARWRLLGLHHQGGVIPPLLQQRGLLSCCGMRGTLHSSQLVLGMVGGRGVAVTKGSRTAIPMLESGVRAGSLSANPWQGFHVEL